MLQATSLRHRQAPKHRRLAASLVLATLVGAGCGVPHAVEPSSSALEAHRADQEGGRYLTGDYIAARLAAMAQDPQTAARINAEPVRDAELAKTLAPRAEVLGDIGANKARIQPRASAAPQIAYASLRAYDTAVESQGARSTCSAFATAAAMENLARQQTGASYNLSEEQLWSYYQRPYELDALKYASYAYLTSSNYWPYDPRAGYQGSPTVADPASLGRVRMHPSQDVYGPTGVYQALLRRHPVIIVADVTQALMNVPSDGVVAPGAYGLGTAHVMEVVGINPDTTSAYYTGGGYYVIKNSWGTYKGDRGYVYLPFSYCSSTATCYFWEVPGVDVR